MTAIESLDVSCQITSRGDATVFVAPRKTGSGAVPVLHCTAADGTGYAITLSHHELARLRATAHAILKATPDTIDTWLDQAAETLLAQRHTG